MTVPLRRRAAALLVGVGLLTAAGCSADPAGEPAPGGSPTSAAAEDVRAAGAEVAAGLRKIESLAGQVAAARGAPAAQGLVAQIEPTWATIEGTVKANDPDAYLALEDAFAQLGKAAGGDAAAAASGAAAVLGTVTAYLSKYPG
jgi:hypothetical protein